MKEIFLTDSIKYIFVDLDGTLIKTDLFIESMLKLIKQSPLSIFKLIFWILQGRSVAKHKIAKVIKVNPEILPYENELVLYLEKQRQKEDKVIILATASNQEYAKQVAFHLGFFDKIIASDKKRNLKGTAKLAEIKGIAAGNPFIYAGNSVSDRPIWNEASSNIFVNAPEKDIEEAQKKGKVTKIINSNHSKIKSFLTEMRCFQWGKNILIFVSLLTSHKYTELEPIFLSLAAFLCFSLCASGVYFFNDMFDLDSDRLHKRKRYRPLASGDLSLHLGVAGAIGFPLIAFFLSLYFLPLSFVGILFIYYLITNIYSLFLKKFSTIDVIVLAILYTIRVVAGAQVIDVEISFWLIAFSFFFFMSLAYVKRYIELSSSLKMVDKIPGRGYSRADLETIFTLGISNITASVFVMALYLNSDEVVHLYRSPKILWCLCLLISYWGNRIWVGVRRGKISEDPIVFALRDRVSIMVGLSALIIIFIAKHIRL